MKAVLLENLWTSCYEMQCVVFLYSNYKCILPTTSSFLLEISFFATYITIFLLKPFPEVYSPLLSLLVFRSRGGFTTFLSSFFLLSFPLVYNSCYILSDCLMNRLTEREKKQVRLSEFLLCLNHVKKATHHKHLSAIPM